MTVTIMGICDNLHQSIYFLHDHNQISMYCHLTQLAEIVHVLQSQSSCYRAYTKSNHVEAVIKGCVLEVGRVRHLIKN